MIDNDCLQAIEILNKLRSLAEVDMGVMVYHQDTPIIISKKKELELVIHRYYERQGLGIIVEIRKQNFIISFFYSKGIYNANKPLPISVQNIIAEFKKLEKYKANITRDVVNRICRNIFIRLKQSDIEELEEYNPCYPKIAENIITTITTSKRCVYFRNISIKGKIRGVNST